MGKARAPRARKVATFNVEIDVALADRLLFLARTVNLGDMRKVTERAINYFDRAVCAALDGSKIIARGRNGKEEDFNPCKP